MKKIISKIKKSLKNSGSSLVLVIVALGFIGILTGALLTAVGYAYRLKMYDYNAKSNFYYLEQAMDEIYAGVGIQTMKDMQMAYQETREEVVKYDPATKTYKHIKNELANDMFKKTFMQKLSTQSFYNLAYTPGGDVDKTTGLAYELQNLISNSSIQLDADKLVVKKYYAPGGDTDSLGNPILSKVIIKNVTLTRTAEYNRSSAKGMFTQTISTDLEISRPDFEVSFSSIDADLDHLFSFCMVADSGVEINEQPGDVLTINGNIYAASDFYNKTYNRYNAAAEATITNSEYTTTSVDADGNTTSTTYKMNKVSNYAYGDAASTTLFNKNAFMTELGSKYDHLYDGNTDRSKYSGFYIDGSNVNVLANYFIVPGSISVMNSGDLTVYGLDGSNIGDSNVWTDEVVLAGYSPINSSGKKVGSSAVFNANLYVKDDTQVESENSTLKFNGGYYGYSNSATSDSRVFLPTTAREKHDGTNIYQQYVEDVNGNLVTQNRGHYNSSAIIVNGEHATVDLSNLDVLYIAGRSYIELSHQKTGSSSLTGQYTDVNNEDFTINSVKNRYEYDAITRDYRMGESISVKSNQVAYIPVNTPWPAAESRQRVPQKQLAHHFEADVPAKLGTSYFFIKYFGQGISTSTVESIPVTYREAQVSKYNGAVYDGEKTVIMYYIDFQYVADHNLSMFTDAMIPVGVDKADYIEQNFIKDYFDLFNYYDAYTDPGTYPQYTSYITNHVDTAIFDADIMDILKDVTYYKDLLNGEIAIPDQDSSASTVKTYSSGVLTHTGTEIFGVNDENKYRDAANVEHEVDFRVVTSKGSVIDSTLAGDTTHNTANATNATNFSKNYQKHFNYVKWALKDVEEGSDDANTADSIVTDNGEGCITPINKFMNFDYISDSDNLMADSPSEPSAATDINPTNLPLDGYKVWVSNGDVEVQCSDASEKNTVTGIIIAKGDVYFNKYNGSDSYKSVNKFNGLIITGGKVYVNNDVTSITSTELCKSIVTSCIVKASEATNTEDATLMAQGRKACRFLSLFKSYEQYANDALSGTRQQEETRSITNIDYSDVIRYNNWMRNVD